jgi:hypothetical protein
MEKFVERVKKIKVGPPLDPSTFMGALITKDHFDKVWSYIELARAEGGTHSFSFFLSFALSFSLFLSLSLDQEIDVFFEL